MQRPKITFTTIEQIRSHRWGGNAYIDMPAFEAIEEFCRSTPDRELQREAVYLMGRDGMGIDEQVSDAELESFLDDANIGTN